MKALTYSIITSSFFKNHNIEKGVGNDLNTFFFGRIVGWGWWRLWRDFRRMYDLTIHKDKTVGEVCALGWGEGSGEVWGWRRRLMAWEEKLVLEEVKILLSNVSLHDSRPDVWLWRPNTGDGYTVSGVYQLFMR